MSGKQQILSVIMIYVNGSYLLFIVLNLPVVERYFSYSWEDLVYIALKVYTIYGHCVTRMFSVPEWKI